MASDNQDQIWTIRKTKNTNLYTQPISSSGNSLTEDQRRLNFLPEMVRQWNTPHERIAHEAHEQIGECLIVPPNYPPIPRRDKHSDARRRRQSRRSTRRAANKLQPKTVASLLSDLWITGWQVQIYSQPWKVAPLRHPLFWPGHGPWMSLVWLL